MAPGCVAAVLTVLARVGGGEKFDPGTQHDGGFDFDGELDAWVVQLLLRLVFSYPKVTVPLVVIGGLLLWWRERTSARAATRRAIERAEAEQRKRLSADVIQGWVDALQKSDPSFQLLPFFDRVKATFLEVQEAWFRRDLSPVRHLLSDAVYQRLMAQLELLRLQGARDAVANMTVFDLALVLLSRSPHYDALHVRVTFRASDTEVATAATDDEARRAASQLAPSQEVEIWSFSRRPGAQTRPGVDLPARRCPSCGAPFTAGATQRCAHCSAIVNSGQHDWVLTEITQASVYRPSHRELAGLARAQQTDPTLTREGLEDRAALTFWRWVLARATGRSAELRALARPEVVDAVAAEHEANQARQQTLQLWDVAVGSLDLMRVVPGEHRELAHFELIWSGKVGVVAAGQSIRGQPVQNFRQVLTLSRPAGTRPPIELGLSTLRCSTCAGPLEDSTATGCAFCGAPLGPSGLDWVLDGFEPWERYLAQVQSVAAAQSPQRLQERVPGSDERRRLLMLAARMAAADGAVVKRERALLRRWAERFSVPWADVEAMLGAPGEAPFPSKEAAQAFLGELIELALVDGRIDGQERALLEAVAKHAGLVDLLATRLERERR